MQISDETFVCDSCENELALEQQCNHDPKTVHDWCIDCCENFQEKKYPRDSDQLRRPRRLTDKSLLDRNVK